MRVLTITLILSLGAAATSAEEGGPYYAYCPEDPDVQALTEETIDNIFKYLGDEEHPIKYIHIDHGHIERMHTCAKCYDASGTMVGGKEVTPCGKLLGDDVDRYYDAITVAAVEHQGGLVPDMFIWADCFSWTSNAISFGPDGFGYLDQRNKYRNRYGYAAESYPDDEEDDVVLNDIGVDSCRWLLQDHPIKYIHIDHGHIERMHTCAKCYNAPGTVVGGKEVTPCGKLLADDVDRYYDAITAAANEHQGGLVPDMFIWADCFSWTSNAISFGLYKYQKDEYRNKYGYPPSETIKLNDIGVDSCRWLLQDHPKLVMHPWEYSINMLSNDAGQDLVPEWTMTQFAKEFVEGIPVSICNGNYPPYWPDPYPQYRLAGCPTGFPERFIEYGRSGKHKNTKYYMGRGGVYLGLQLLDSGDDVITKTTPAGVPNSEEPILKTGQCIEGSLWHHVPEHFDEWPEHLGAQEDWYYAEQNLGKLVDTEFRDIYDGEYSHGDVEYARFRVHFDSYPYDQPSVSEVEFGLGVGGKVWCDDAEFEYKEWPSTEWEPEDNFLDRYFENEGAGGKAFTSWDLTRTGEGSENEIKEYYDTDIFRFVNTGHEKSSCRYDRRKALSDEFYHSAVETDVADFGVYDFTNTQFRVGVRLRAKYIDTYRLGNVWQWQYIIDKYDYLKSDPDRETALGIIPYNASRFAFCGQPKDGVQDWDFNKRHGIHTDVNARAADAAVAEWCWSLNKPRKWYNPMALYDVEIYDTPKVENLWYCPYYIHQQEKTWFEKK
jgi:hypothetical protein